MQVGRNALLPNVRAMHREFSDLAVLAQKWDNRFESATGTYPTAEFAAGYRSLTDRVLRAQKQVDSGGWIVGSEFEAVGRSMWSNYVRATTFTHSRLEDMVKRRETFKPYSGQFGADVPWGSLLDGIISDLQRGERLLYAKLITSPPSTPGVPNPGVPTPTYPTYPTYPGTPQPTPLP